LYSSASKQKKERKENLLKQQNDGNEQRTESYVGGFFQAQKNLW